MRLRSLMPRLQDSSGEGRERPQSEHVLRRFSAGRFQYAAVDGRGRREGDRERGREEDVTADVDRESATTNLTAEMVNCRNG